MHKIPLQPKCPLSAALGLPEIKMKYCFQLSEILEGGIVAGRNCGKAIPVGTVFDSIFIETFPENKDDLSSVKRCMKEEANIELLVVHWYGKTLDEVPEGHTAGLEISQEGLSLLGEFLGKLKKHEYVSIEA